MTNFKSMLIVLILIFLKDGCNFQTESAEWQHMSTILENLQVPTFPEREYILADYGATGDGKTDISFVLSDLIHEVNQAGGGKIILPEGVWFSKGPVHLKSNINLHLKEGAVLLFSQEPEDYLPQVLTRWEGTEAYNFSPLIYAFQASNVAITGKGVIVGNSESGFGTWRPLQGDAQLRLRDMGAASLPVHERVFGMSDYLRPSMIQFFGSSRVLVEGVTIKDSPMWVIHLVYSEHVTVRNVHVESYRLNNVGVSIDSSSIVLIENNRFMTGDDSIVIKSGRDQDGWRVGRPSENIVIRNNYMEGHNALAVGSEMSGGVRHVFMENNSLGKVRSAIYFKSNPDRGGHIKHIRIRNVDVEESNILLHFMTNYHGYRGGDFPSVYRDFLIENITVQRTGTVIEAAGIKDVPIRDVMIKNVNVANAEIGLDTTYTKNFLLHNVTVNQQPIDDFFKKTNN